MSPDRFREELKRFDKSLDIEFNGSKGRYEIFGTDRQNKRYMIKKVPLGQINTLGVETLKELYECSPTKQGGAKRLNERIDDLIAAEEKAEERQLADRIDEHYADAWLHLQHRNGYRVSMHIPDKLEETLIVRDLRRVSLEDDRGTTILNLNAD